MSSKETIGLIPVYVKPNSPDTKRLTIAYKSTLDALRSTVSHVVVVNDGGCIEGATITSADNQGKASAVRQGLRKIKEDLKGKSGYIIQTDADLDQDPSDARLFNEFFANNKISSEESVLVIGDRYFQDQGEKCPHRQGMLVFQRAFSLALGYDVRDPVSGFRAYTSEYLEKCLELSHSDQYGIEVEQLIIANLIGARVFTIPLSYSRLRDPYTFSSKYLDSLRAVLSHSEDLRSKGLGEFVDFFVKVRDFMGSKTENFSLDLREIGGKEKLQFSLKEGDKYSVEIK